MMMTTCDDDDDDDDDDVCILQVLRLFHFLVKFGYYGTEDIKMLLRPLIAVLDCKHDKPFPQDSDKGYVSYLDWQSDSPVSHVS